MKKLLMAMALAGATMVASAEDNYLYWMVDVGDSTGYAFNYATIKAKDASGENESYLLLYTQDPDKSGQYKSGQRLYASSNGTGTTTGGGAFAGVGGYGLGSQFLFELWAEDGSSVGQTSWIDYSRLAENISADMNRIGASPFTVGATMLVPEPTGGLLTLLGLAVLALRRKQKVA